MIEEAPIQIVFDQLRAILVVLQRPIVLSQLMALLLVLLLARLISQILNRVFTTQISHLSQKRPWLNNINTMVWPLIMLILSHVLVVSYTLRGNPTSLIRGWMWLFWLWLAYNVCLMIINGHFQQEAIRPFHRYVLRPAFAWVIGITLIGSFIELTALGTVKLINIFDLPVTAQQLFSAIVILYLFNIIAWLLGPIIQHTFNLSTDADPGVVHLIITLTRYTVIGLGILAAFGSLGLGLNSLTLIAGGLSVGIGFGLQQIVANFISGIVLLFEQTLRPGDIVDIEGELGVVQKLNIRSTVLRTLQNVELIVPNETFLTSKVRTYTKTNRIITLRLPVSVSYTSDPKHVRAVLLNVVGQYRDVLTNPAPDLLFDAFGDSSLDFNLQVSINGPQKTPLIKSDLNYLIFEALNEHGISIPFPQRDLHLRTGWEQISHNGSNNLAAGRFPVN